VLRGAREIYIQQHKEYLAGRKEKGLLSKVREKLGMGSREEEGVLPESLQKAKADYEKAKIEYAIAMRNLNRNFYYTQFKGNVRYGDLPQNIQQELSEWRKGDDEANKTNTPDYAINDILSQQDISDLMKSGNLTADDVERFKNLDVHTGLEAEIKARVWDEVIVEEHKKIKMAEAESWTPKEKGMFRKGLDAWRGQSRIKRFAISYGLLAGGIAAGLTGQVWLSAGILTVRSAALAGLAGAAIGQLGGVAFEKISKDTADIDDAAQKEVWRDAFINGDINMNFLEDAGEAHNEIDTNTDEKKRVRQTKKMLVMAGTGLLGAVGLRWLGGAVSEYLQGTGGAENISGGGESPKVPDVAPGPETVNLTPEPDFESGGIPQGTDVDVVPFVVEGISLGEVSTAQESYFEGLHNTSYDPDSPLDQAKMNIVQILEKNGIMGSSSGEAIPSPLVDKAIESLYDSRDVEGWAHASEMLGKEDVIEKIKVLQAQALANPGATMSAQDSIKNLIK
jgi:hypothetical protein